MNEVLEQIEKIGIIPVVALEDLKDAELLGRALIDGGLPCVEVTFRTDAAEQSIRIIKEKFPDMLVGAGTVLTIEQVDKAIDAGAQFIVSPGINPKVVEYCIKRNITIVPGTCTPSDIKTALGFGLDVVKVFPTEVMGGINYIKAVAAPYVGMKFMPTGGINENNVREYLKYDRVLACGGSWMVNKELIQMGNFEKIKELTREAVSIVKEVRKKATLWETRNDIEIKIS